jgi:hypothetical protein
MKAFKAMRGAIYSCPSLLLDMPSKYRRIADNYLPVESGIEIEAVVKEGKRVSEFNQKLSAISGISQYNQSSDTNEVRIRICGGIAGMLALEQALELVKDYYDLNPKSGIHYHVSFSMTSYLGSNFTKNNKEWVLNSLKCWNYTGTYNQWTISRAKEAVRIHEAYDTIEYRIGEMSFDYSLIMKRLVHAQSITRGLREFMYKSYDRNFTSRERRLRHDANYFYYPTRKYSELPIQVKTVQPVANVDGTMDYDTLSGQVNWNDNNLR